MTASICQAMINVTSCFAHCNGMLKQNLRMGTSSRSKYSSFPDVLTCCSKFLQKVLNVEGLPVLGRLPSVLVGECGWLRFMI